MATGIPAPLVVLPACVPVEASNFGLESARNVHDRGKGGGGGRVRRVMERGAGGGWKGV